MSEPLTKLERQVLDYIIEFLRRNTYQPSVREIGRRFDIKSTKTVSELIHSLAEKGYVEREPARSRGVRILNFDPDGEVVHAPYYGRVAAGSQPLDPDEVVDRFGIDRSLVPSEAVYFLRVEGSSMEDAGLLDGDLVLVDPLETGENGKEVEDGAIVAARADGSTVVKRFFHEGEGVVLRSDSPTHPPIVPEDVDDYHLLGRVVGLYRRLDGEHRPRES